MDQAMIPQPLVSVLVVAYNQAVYLPQTLDALLAQECPFTYEILLGEDCSTDSTRAICMDYAKRYPDTIRLYLNERNKGLIRNYFDLMSHARGVYLADCGGDDYWLTSTKLQQQVAILERFPEVVMVGGNWQLLDQATGAISSNRMQLTEDWYQPTYYGRKAVLDYLNQTGYPQLVLSTACFRADALKRLMDLHPALFTGKEVVCEDLPITLLLLQEGPIYFMKEDVMIYRVLPQSISHTTSAFDLVKGFTNKALWQTLTLASELGLTVKELKPYLSRQLPDLIYTAFVTNDCAWMKQQRNRLRLVGVRFMLKQRVMMALLPIFCWMGIKKANSV